MPSCYGATSEEYPPGTAVDIVTHRIPNTSWKGTRIMATPQHRMPNLRHADGGEHGQSRQREENDGRMGEACDQAGQIVRDHPASSALATFGVGVAIGSALVFVLGPSRRKPSWAEQAQASGGHLRDVVMQLLPDALSRHLSK